MTNNGLFNNVFSWFKDRWFKIPEHDSKVYNLTLLSMVLANIASVVIIALANPTGINFLLDFIIYLLLTTIAFYIFTILFAFLLSLLYLPLPRLSIGSIVFTWALAYYILSLGDLGRLFSIVVSFSFILISMIIGAIGIILFSKQLSLKIKILALVLPMLIIVLIYRIPFFKESEIPAFSDVYAETTVTPILDESPAKAGDFSVNYFTYGSGRDKHRKEYGDKVTLISKTADASSYIDKWPRSRELFWGFNEKELPLNGRVWLPHGDGPFPIVLITHGNHKMEYFSDAGYGYLGELLASRGFITISLDQNFLNYSNWSGIPKKDMELRAWIILHHLLQVDEFSNTPGTPFYQKVDFERVALIGHSRGGLASTMAVDYKKWFADDPSLEGVEKFQIQSVIGLATTDKAVDDKIPHLWETNYLVIHGAQDADVNSFRGDRQYERASFSSDSKKFKASLYLAEANHSYFNTDWGKKDLSLPGGLFLNHRDTMDSKEQREITKVYVSAFLETTLLGNNRYEKLFHNYQYGLQWLPETLSFSRYQNGMFKPMDNFNASSDRSVLKNGIRAEAEEFTLWEIEKAKDRRGNNKGNSGTILQWDREASYSIFLSDSYINRLAQGPDSFILSIANMARDLDTEISLSPQVEVEFKNKIGESIQVPLDEYMPVPAEIKVQYTKIPWFDKTMKGDKYQEEQEPVFHMYEIKLDRIKSLNYNMSFENISEIILHFSNGPGKVMIDDIGYISYPVTLKP
ncbi:MAG: alpha/beta hydrolase [Clostridiales bacterium]|nr:alpha/beta hydrolase [Clostridiales bacterium]